jgi:hypothetical protein
MRRVNRSIQYQFKKGRITESQANWYVRHPLLWYARELKIPLLYAAGIINEIVLAFLLISGGSISRTVYTSYRMTQAAVEGKEIPWVAFVLGLVPMLIGNIAYPCQMLYSASGKRGKVAKFIVYDTFTRLGDKFPIWGNEDTLTEHFFNYLADKLVRFAGFSRKKFLSPRDANTG